MFHLAVAGFCISSISSCGLATPCKLRQDAIHWLPLSWPKVRTCVSTKVLSRPLLKDGLCGAAVLHGESGDRHTGIINGSRPSATITTLVTMPRTSYALHNLKPPGMPCALLEYYAHLDCFNVSATPKIDFVFCVFPAHGHKYEHTWY